MIRYTLRCARGHQFESWFQSSSAYESQERRHLINCPSCGSAEIERAIMAPQIVSKKGREPAQPAPASPVEATATESTSLMMAQERELRSKLKELRDHIVKNADNVGDRFPNEARKMHYGDIEHRPIYGEASPEEARALIDEGVLTTWVLDSATARELGLVTTGHAHRGVSSSPSPGTYNLHLEPGAVTPKQLISDIKQGFYVTDLIGSGVNGVTGDYSRGAGGFWIENGEIAYPVSEVTVAGKLTDLYLRLRRGSDLEFRGAFNVPSLMFDAVAIAGK